MTEYRGSLRRVTTRELTKNCLMLGKLTKGSYNIQWMESTSLSNLYLAIELIYEIAKAENNGK